MATQNLQSNPLVVTAAMKDTLKNYKGPAWVPKGRFIVSKVVWCNSQTNGDTYAITDGASSQAVTIAQGVAVTADLGVPQTINPGVEVTDLQVTQLSSGFLQIYLAELDG